ncbi:hypothetical protein V8C42DRAFT_326413 [Trichoderma barbatum]
MPGGTSCGFILRQGKLVCIYLELQFSLLSEFRTPQLKHLFPCVVTTAYLVRRTLQNSARRTRGLQNIVTLRRTTSDVAQKKTAYATLLSLLSKQRLATTPLVQRDKLLLRRLVALRRNISPVCFRLVEMKRLGSNSSLVRSPNSVSDMVWRDQDGAQLLDASLEPDRGHDNGNGLCTKQFRMSARESVRVRIELTGGSLRDASANLEWIKMWLSRDFLAASESLDRQGDARLRQTRILLEA